MACARQDSIRIINSFIRGSAEPESRGELKKTCSPSENKHPFLAEVTSPARHAISAPPRCVVCFAVRALTFESILRSDGLSRPSERALSISKTNVLEGFLASARWIIMFETLRILANDLCEYPRDSLSFRTSSLSIPVDVTDAFDVFNHAVAQRCQESAFVGRSICVTYRDS